MNFCWRHKLYLNPLKIINVIVHQGDEISYWSWPLLCSGEHATINSGGQRYYTESSISDDNDNDNDNDFNSGDLTHREEHWAAFLISHHEQTRKYITKQALNLLTPNYVIWRKKYKKN